MRDCHGATVIVVEITPTYALQMHCMSNRDIREFSMGGEARVIIDSDDHHEFAARVALLNMEVHGYIAFHILAQKDITCVSYVEAADTKTEVCVRWMRLVVERLWQTAQSFDMTVLAQETTERIAVEYELLLNEVRAIDQV